MIHVFLGTKAQLIKMAPVMRELQDRDIAYNFVFTGQHRETINDILDNFRIKDPDHILYDGPDIVSIPRMLAWSLSVLKSCIVDRKRIWGNHPANIVLNHGDTLTALLGSIAAKLLGFENAHIESGLRSFNIFHPFPEELTRLLVFRLTDYYFAPGPWALDNLIKYKGVKVDTGANTLLDALRLFHAQHTNSADTKETGPYAIASIHRFENISTCKRLTRIVAILERIAERQRLIFILHKPTEKRLISCELFDRLKNNTRIDLHPRYDFFDFIRLLEQAEFIVTDGGSNQEESFYLNKPCLLLRKHTERREGLNESMVISNFDSNRIDYFVRNFHVFYRKDDLDSVRPSKLIVDRLLEDNSDTVRENYN